MLIIFFPYFLIVYTVIKKISKIWIFGLPYKVTTPVVNRIPVVNQSAFNYFLPFNIFLFHNSYLCTLGEVHMILALGEYWQYGQYSSRGRSRSKHPRSTATTHVSNIQPRPKYVSLT